MGGLVRTRVLLLVMSLAFLSGCLETASIVKSLTEDTSDSESDSGPKLVEFEEAYYTFDEVVGGVYENLYDDFLEGEPFGVSVVDGKVNNGLYFDSSSTNYVRLNDYDGKSVTDMIFPDGEMSFEGWVKFESLDLATKYHFFGDQNTGVKSFKAEVVDGQFRVIIYDWSDTTELVRTSYVFGLDTWYHIAFTFDGVNSRFYIDGALNNSATVSGALSRVGNDLYIGGGHGMNTFPGYIDEFGYYSRELTAVEVAASYNANK